MVRKNCYAKKNQHQWTQAELDRVKNLAKKKGCYSGPVIRKLAQSLGRSFGAVEHQLKIARILMEKRPVPLRGRNSTISKGQRDEIFDLLSKDARMPLTDIGKMLDIPTSTLFDFVTREIKGKVGWVMLPIEEAEEFQEVSHGWWEGIAVNCQYCNKRFKDNFDKYKMVKVKRKLLHEKVCKKNPNRRKMLKTKQLKTRMGK